MEKISIKPSGIICELTAITFKEDGVFVSFCPSLDVAGYAETEEKALKSLELVIQETIDYCKKKNTLNKYLLQLGWVFKSKNNAISPNVLNRISNSDYLSNIIQSNHSILFNNGFKVSA
jgi:predicted RNase H-like HicB family nuclease